MVQCGPEFANHPEGSLHSYMFIDAISGWKHQRGDGNRSFQVEGFRYSFLIRTSGMARWRLVRRESDISQLNFYGVTLFTLLVDDQYDLLLVSGEKKRSSVSP
jgi:hypothetical protein